MSVDYTERVFACCCTVSYGFLYLAIFQLYLG